MKFSRIHFILNPSSAKEEPILNYINEMFDNTEINWEVSIIKKGRSGRDIAQMVMGQTDLIAVYGGDGCVTDVASALHGTNMPLAIIPAGTANVMAKELMIPVETKAALELLKTGNNRLMVIDMGLMNGQPFLLRVNLGIMADMILNANQNLKENIGQLAYGVAVIKTIADAEPMKYRLEIDGKIIEENGVALTITNSGHIGIFDLALQPDISITDGLLDVILMRDVSFLSLLKVAGSTLLQNETDALKHWKCRQVVINLESEHTFICDDAEKIAQQLVINVVPASINIVVPDEGV